MDRNNLRLKMNNLTKMLEDNAIFVITLVTILSSILVYFPFWLDGTTDILFRYWDGPNYAYLAESMYTIPKNHPLSAYTTPEYFSAHLPVYPFSIRLLSFFGYLNAMLITTVIYGVLAAVVFYKLLRETGLVKSPLWSAIISLFIPARYLIYHSVGATEAPFIFFTLWSMLAYLRGQYVLCFVLAGLSGITRITGILIGGAYFIMLIQERKWKQIPLLALIPIPLLAMFTFYHFHYGDFFAYFGTNYSDSNKLISLKPFDLFQNYSGHGNTHSSEFYLMMYAIYAAGTALLWSKNRLFFWYCAITFVFCSFIYHQDVSRYLIPMAPLALIVAYDDIFSKKPFKVLFFPALVLVYIYTWGMLPKNMIDAGNFSKLERHFSAQIEVHAIKGGFEQINAKSCGYGACRSEIKGRDTELAAPTRGLNLYGYFANEELRPLATIDLCDNEKAFASSPSLSTLIKNPKDKPLKILIITDDTVPCFNKGMKDIKQWSKGYNLKKLENIGIRDAYIGVIDLEKNSVVELSGSKKVTWPSH